MNNLKLALVRAIDRVVNNHAKELMETKNNDFDKGALFGISLVLDVIKNELKVFAPNLVEDLGLDFDIEKEIQ